MAEQLQHCIKEIQYVDVSSYLTIFYAPYFSVHFSQIFTIFSATALLSLFGSVFSRHTCNVLSTSS